MKNYVLYAGDWHDVMCAFVSFDEGVCNCKTGRNRKHIEAWLCEVLTSHAISAVAAREAELREGIEGMKMNPALHSKGSVGDIRNRALDEVLALLPENKSTDL